MYRNGLITSFSIAIALIYGETQDEYSTQQRLVARAMNSAIILSTTCTVRIRALEKNKDHPSDPMTLNIATWVLTILSVVVVVKTWIWTQSECGQYQLSLNPANISGVLLWTAFGLYIFTQLVKLQFVYRKIFGLGKTEGRRRCYIYTIVICWSITIGFEILTAEVEMRAQVLVSQSGSIPIDLATTSRWGLGQVMAIVMLALPVWDITTFWYEENKPAVDKFLSPIPLVRRLIKKRSREGHDDMEMGMLQRDDVEQGPYPLAYPEDGFVRRRNSGFTTIDEDFPITALYSR